MVHVINQNSGTYSLNTWTPAKKYTQTLTTTMKYPKIPPKISGFSSLYHVSTSNAPQVMTRFGQITFGPTHDLTSNTHVEVSSDSKVFEHKVAYFFFCVLERDCTVTNDQDRKSPDSSITQCSYLRAEFTSSYKYFLVVAD